MSDCIVLIVGMSRGELSSVLVKENDYSEATIALDRVEDGLIGLLASLETNCRINAFFVLQKNIHGFAAMRLLLITLNTYAWLHDIPISALPQDRDRALEERIHDIRQAVRSRPHFNGQLLPAYDGPADITVSQRKNKFTLS